MEAGHAQDSGVETECDVESNDSTMSSVSVAGPDSSSGGLMPPGPAGDAAGDGGASGSRDVTTPEPPPPPSGTPEPPLLIGGGELAATVGGGLAASGGGRFSFPANPASEELLNSGSFMTSHAMVHQSQEEEEYGVGGASTVSPSTSHHHHANSTNHTHPSSSSSSSFLLLNQAEDGYLGDCSSDGGNEKNFPLPPDWKACHHPSRHSLPPSPASSQHPHSPPPLMTSPPPPPIMEDVEPPAGLEFNMIQQNTEPSLNGLGYQILSHQTLRDNNRSQTTLRTKMRTPGFRSKYNCHVGDDWTRVKTAIAERKLRLAANTNNGELVEKLCNNNVNVRCADEHKRSPLHLAAAKGYTEVVDILLKHGADPNQKDLLGNTPLHLAACTNHVPVITLLLRAGTDITTIDNNGRTPLQLAQAKLKLLQKSSSATAEMSKVKSEVGAVLEMMRVYLRRCQQHHLGGTNSNSSSNSNSCNSSNPTSTAAYSQLIDSFSQRLTFHTTGTSLSNDLGNLLQSLGSMTITGGSE